MGPRAAIGCRNFIDFHGRYIAGCNHAPRIGFAAYRKTDRDFGILGEREGKARLVVEPQRALFIFCLPVVE